ncbi:MAG: hypothetical protein Q4E35_03905 [Eubacteriales bacterium]|nr:hypothetical protein [Eubacteriales bacterium]
MCASVSVYCFIVWMQEKMSISFILACAFSLLGTMFHSGVIGLAVGYAVILFLYDRHQNTYRLSFRNIFMTALVVLLFVFIYTNYSELFFSYFMRADSIEDIASGVGEGGSTYAQYVGNSSSILNMAIYTVPRLVYFLFSPFPWQWRGLSDIIAVVFNSLFYIITYINMFKYLKRKTPENRAIVIALMIVALCVAFIYGWGVSNTGTAVRHRDKMIALYTILWCCTSNGKRRTGRYI